MSNLVNQSSHEQPQEAVPSVEALLSILPLETAASVDPYEDVNGSLYVACREVPEAAASPLHGLSQQQYKALLLRTQGMSYEGVAKGMSLKVSSVRRHLSNALGKLDSYGNGIHAARYIPMEAEQVRSTMRGGTAGHEDLRLNGPESEVFALIGNGLVYKAIASERGCSKSTIRTHVMSIKKKFGFQRAEERAVTNLYRLAGAALNLEQYGHLTNTVTQVLTPPINAYLQGASVQAETGRLPSLDTAVVKGLSRQALLADLEQGRFIPPGTAKHGNVDLSGLIAALLLERSDTQALLRGQKTRFIARKIIATKIDKYLQASPAGKQPAT
jgi:DNA-binding CsgD family transcriptional regulator